MKTGRWKLSRRAFLGGAGSLIALPLLEQMLPGTARAAGGSPAPVSGNLVVWHFPTSWCPTPGALLAEGATSGPMTAAALGPVFQPFAQAGLLGDLTIVTPCTNPSAYDTQAGDHARGCGAMLTCMKPAMGQALNVGPSMDFVAAQALGASTKLQSLQVGTNPEAGAGGGTCDSSYPCPDQFNTTWTDKAVPLPPQVDPGVVFNRMFAGSDPGATQAEQQKRLLYRKSVLDYSLDQQTRLKARLNPRDAAKVDQLLTSIRDYETRLAATATNSQQCGQASAPAGGIPADVRDHVSLMNALTTLALQCNIAPVVTFSYENTVSERQHTFLTTADGRQVTDGWHIGITHHNGDPFKIAEQQAVNTWIVSQFVALAAKLKGTAMPDGSTLLDHTILMGVSDMGDQAHNHSNMRPMLLGGAALGVKTGRLIVNGAQTNLANVYTGVLQALKVPVTRFGDATGVVSLTS